ncbi:MAG TPA: shikimate dehydrogenase [Ktedonobacterales bacterium]|nr:shikimate dehydrogenase [Ktedonobacterales bacterium]
MRYVGLIGYPVAHSLSPRMQQAAFEEYGIEARYVLWETPPDTLPARIETLRAPGMIGANVTIPYKAKALALVDECDTLAARVGALNTIVNRDGRLTGYNTDVHGFIRALAESAGHLLSSEKGRRAVIVGTGGAARAAAAGLLENGFEELLLLGRTEAHLVQLQHDLQRIDFLSGSAVRIRARQFGNSDLAALFVRTDLLVNATPVGLHENDAPLPVDVTLLPTTAVVIDMIFNPPETPLLRAATARGCQTINGLSMLLYQGAQAFELWTGLDAPVDAMRKALSGSQRLQGFLT